MENIEVRLRLSLAQNHVEPNSDDQHGAGHEMVSCARFTLLRDLVIAAQDQDAHFTGLDAALSSLLPHALHCHPNQMKEQSGSAADIPQVAKLLHRLTRTPQNSSSLGLN